MKLIIRFKDGLEKIQEFDAPRGEAGYYLPTEFFTGRPDRVENVLVRQDSELTHKSKHPVYIEYRGPRDADHQVLRVGEPDEESP